MKALILSCATGEGHNSAAKALYEYFRLSGIECEKVDTLSLISPVVSQTVSDLYIFSTKTRLFELIYNTGTVVSKNIFRSPVYYANKLYCGKLLEYIQKNKFDTLICTHLFPAEALSSLIKSGVLRLTSVFISTDYTCMPFLNETRLDYYVIPHEHLIEEYVKNKLPREKILPYGIPVKQEFYTAQSKALARKECKRVFGNEINEHVNWLLIMLGSMGFGNIKGLIKQLISDMKKDSFEIFLVCGNNAKLKAEFNMEFGHISTITVLGFTNKIATLMDACDVLFTKPGGLSSTEAAAKHIPIIHTSPIPGIESKNAYFFHHHGMSYSTTDVKEQVSRALRLCNDKPYRERMIAAQKMHINANSSADILSICMQSVQSGSGEKV